MHHPNKSRQWLLSETCTFPQSFGAFSHFRLELGRRWGCRFDAVGVTNQPHQSPSRPRASPSGMTCLVQCVQRNRISLRDKQLASINTVYIFLYIYLQLYINKLNNRMYWLSPVYVYLLVCLSVCLSVCLFVEPRRQSGIAHYPSPRRPTVNHLPRPRRPSAAVAPTVGTTNREMTKSKIPTCMAKSKTDQARSLQNNQSILQKNKIGYQLLEDCWKHYTQYQTYVQIIQLNKNKQSKA